MDIPRLGVDTLPPNALTVRELGGRSLGRPDGTFRFAHPRTVVDGRGRLHLLWGEPAGGARPMTTWDWQIEEKVAAIWTATYEHENGWSVPRPVFDPGRAVLAWQNVVAAAQDDGAEVHRWVLSMSATRSKGSSAVVLFRLADDSLVASEIPWVAGPPSYSSVAAAGGEMFLGFIAPAPRERAVADGGPRINPDVNSVFLRTSSDGGATWRPPVLVSRSGVHAAYELKVLRSPDGIVHLFWLQERPDMGEVLRHVSSADGGRTWSAPDDVEPPAGNPNLSFQAAADACGTLHVIYAHRSLETVQGDIDYLTWRGRWSPIEHLFTEWNANQVTLHRAPDGRLRVAFLAVPAAGPITAPFVTLYSERALVR